MTSFADPTFSVENYKVHRPRYPDRLYNDILEFHDSQGGQRNLAVDLGCGPGFVTESLVSFFPKVIGIDPSTSMVELASKSIGDKVDVLSYKVGSAEDIPVEEGTVDLITAGTAAHWFSPDWWNSAAKVLRPNGTVALFAFGRPFIAPSSHPEAVRLNNMTRQLETSALKDYLRPENTVNRNMLQDLPLPSQDTGLWGKVDHRIWNKDGVVGADGVYMTEKMTLSQVKARARTGSPIHRWEEANKDKIGTMDDPVEKYAAEIKELTGWSDDSVIELGQGCSLILVKRL